MATNLPFPIFKSTGDDKRDMEIFEEDLKDYCTLNNLYDPSKSPEEERWIKTDKAIACLRACVTHSQMKSVRKNMADFELHVHYSHGILTDHSSNACGRHFPLPPDQRAIGEDLKLVNISYIGVKRFF